jgi:hypothetical protein
MMQGSTLFLQNQSLCAQGSWEKGGRLPAKYTMNALDIMSVYLMYYQS